jgi:hypothetical protein
MHSKRDIFIPLSKMLISILGVTDDEVHASAMAKLPRKKYMGL